MKRVCPQCGSELPPKTRQNRKNRFCGPGCVREYRSKGTRYRSKKMEKLNL